MMSMMDRSRCGEIMVGSIFGGRLFATIFVLVASTMPVCEGVIVTL
jgi:hypothetical protein